MVDELPSIAAIRAMKAKERKEYEAQFAEDEGSTHISTLRTGLDPNSMAWHMLRRDIGDEKALASAVQDMSKLAMSALADIVEDINAPAGVRLKAAQYVLDRQLGRPTERKEVTASVTRRNITVTRAAMPEGDLGIIDAEFSGQDKAFSLS